MEAQFAGTCAEEITFGAEDIAEVEQGEEGAVAFRTRRLCRISGSEFAPVLLDVEEAGFAHGALGLHAAGDFYPDFRR